MANTVISLRSSGVSSNTPSLGVLANGELSLNFADGILYYKSAANTLGSIRTTQPTGLNKEIQFNDSGSFGSNASLTFDKANTTLTTNNFVANTITTGTGVGGIIAGANVIYSNVFVANTGGYVQFSDGSKQYTANAGGGSVTSVAGATGVVSNTNILTGLLTVDGTGSGLDADLLDGLNSTSFANATFAQAAFDKANTTLTTNNFVANTITTGTGAGGIIAGANVIYSNVFVANTGGYVQFSDGSKQYTANADGVFAQAAYTHANGAFDKANTDTTNISAAAAVYGNATHVPVITLAANGRVSSIVNTAISGAGGGGNSFGVIYTSNNSTYANASVSTDQINFVGVSGTIVFANSTTKTITIAGTPGAQGLTVDYGFVYESLDYSIDYGTL